MVRHGGGVKLLLKCLQSIQCQYYLVFGVVKTVPLQSFARLRASPVSSLHPLHRRSQKCLRGILFRDPNGSTTTWRTVIDTYIYCIYSVYVVPLLFISLVRVHVSPPWFAFFPPFILASLFHYKDKNLSPTS